MPFHSHPPHRLDDEPSQGDAYGVEHQEILDEIDNLQKGSTSWTSTLLILLVSAALFFGFGMASWSWTTTVTLISVLLFHELGHAVAMWLFRYRNLRMFFIPFFGAAVSGRNYNVPGWKKTVVSLAGPLPGIAVGIVLGIAAMILRNDFLFDAALMAVGVNGFNLLPVLPLDGGWVMHALLFSRHPLFDALFRVLAGAGTFLIGMFLSLKFLAIVGAFMVFGVPHAYRAARVASRLRHSGLISVSTDGQSIPTASAQMIIDEVAADFPNVKHNTAIARLVLQVFEAINARPPGWLATILLGGVYVASGIAAFVFSALFFVARTTDLGTFLEQAANQPPHTFTCDTTRRWQGNQYQDDRERARSVIVATFASREDAEKRFQTLANMLPPDARGKLFGQTLLLELSAEEALRDQWLKELRSIAGNVFLDRDQFRASLTMTCVAPTEEIARRIEADVQAYRVTDGEQQLIPPWSSEHKMTADQRRARATFQRLASALAFADLNPKSQDLRRQMVEARRQGDEAAARKHRQALDELSSTLARQAVDKIQREEPEPLDSEMVDLYLKQPQKPVDGTPEEYEKFAVESRKWLVPMAARMGTLPVNETGSVTPGDKRYSATGGAVSRAGLALRFDRFKFESPLDGVPTFADWLCEQDNVAFKYEIVPSGPDFGDLLKELDQGVQPKPQAAAGKSPADGSGNDARPDPGENRPAAETPP